MKRVLLLFVVLIIAGCAPKTGPADTLKPHEDANVLPDGEYTVNVTLSGGSGKANIESPAKLTVKDGVLTAAIVWSSKNYTYMILDDEKYYPINGEDENSAFEIPVTLDIDMAITAQTIAMSEPRDIDYTLRFDRASVMLALSFAEKFSVSYAGGTPVFIFADGGEFIVNKHPQNIYLAATSAICHFDALDGLDSIKFSGAKADNWYIENAVKAMEEGRITYAGSYSAPDYELLISSGCELAIMSNMISHAPAVKEKFESLGVSVITDMSSYEPHPLGRAEWIVLYGVLLGKQSVAQDIIKEQGLALSAVSGKTPTGKTAVLFYINSKGIPVVRKSGDYAAMMIELAGGSYIFDNIEGIGTINLEPEAFYNTAKDADVIIYNSTVGEEVESISKLIQKNGLIADFKAVRGGMVYCTTKNFYQDTTGFSYIIADMRAIFEDNHNDTAYIRRLR